MSSDGKIRVVVRSRKVPSRTVEISEPVYSTSGIPMWTRRNRLIVYDYVLDEEHNKAIQEGRRLACSLGLDLEVVDATRRGILGRVRSSLGRGHGRRPTLEITPSSKGRQGMSSTVQPVRRP